MTSLSLGVWNLSFIDDFTSVVLVILGSHMKVFPFVESGGRLPEVAIFKHSIIVYFQYFVYSFT